MADKNNHSDCWSKAKASLARLCQTIHTKIVGIEFAVLELAVITIARVTNRQQDSEQMRQVIEEILGATATGVFIVGVSMIDVSDPVVVTSGAAILAALTGAIKVLWDRNSALTKATDVALARCEQEHSKAAIKYDLDIQKASEKYEMQQQRSAEQMNVLIKQVIELSGEVGTMKGRIQGFQEATKKAEDDARAFVNPTHA